MGQQTLDHQIRLWEIQLQLVQTTKIRLQNSWNYHRRHCGRNLRHTAACSSCCLLAPKKTAQDLSESEATKKPQKV
jgi:hypothetical protein